MVMVDIDSSSLKAIFHRSSFIATSL